MNTKHAFWLAIVGIVTITGGFGLWHMQRTEREAVIRANNTPLFKWASGDSRGELVLTVNPNPQLRSVVSVPPVPVNARLQIKGVPGTVAQSAVVQVLNQRSRESVAIVAAPDGSFELTVVAAERGDVLRMIAFTPPRIEPAQDAIVSVQPAGP